MISYEVIDLLGKKIVNTITKQQFDLILESLVAETYILKLNFENATTFN